MSYTVEHRTHGIVLIGPVPLGDLGAVQKLGEDHGYDFADALVSGHLHESEGVSMALTNAEGSKAWRAELGLAPR